MPIAVAAAAIAGLVLLVAWGRVHPFLAFVVVAAGAAFGLGMPAGDVAAAIRAGIGGTLGSLAIVLVTGAMLGKLVVESGAAQRIASVMVVGFGSGRIAWAMALTGLRVL
jgi:Gnt-I system high-affinity gluconate transporter